MLKKVAKNIQPAIGLTLGGVGSGLLVKNIPDLIFKDNPKHAAMAKNAAVIALGLFIMGGGFGKDKMIGHVGAGMIAGAGARLASDAGIGGIGEYPEINFSLDEITGPGNQETISGGFYPDGDYSDIAA